MWLGAHDCITDNFIAEAINYLEKNSSVVLYYPKARYFEQWGTLLENADSEIELNSNSAVDRMMKVVTNLSKCTAIHGVFRTEPIQKIPFNKVGADHLVLFLIASYGIIESSPSTHYFRREVRKETQEEFIVRMKNYDMGNANSHQAYLIGVFLMHFKYLFDNENLTFSEKQQLFMKLRDLCVYRFPNHFTRAALLKYFLFTNIDLKVAIMLPLAYLFEFQHLLKRKLVRS